MTNINNSQNKIKKNRKDRRSTTRSRDRLKNVKEFVDYLYDKQFLGKSLGFKVLKYILIMTCHGRRVFPSIEYLGQEMEVHKNSIPRITRELRDAGLIIKTYRGYNTSVEYKVAPMLRDPEIRHYLSGFFPFLKGFSLSFFCFSLAASNAFRRADVNLYNKDLYINKINNKEGDKRNHKGSNNGLENPTRGHDALSLREILNKMSMVRQN